MNFLETLKKVFKTSVPDSSKPGTLDTTDWAKLARHTVIVSASAGVTYLIDNVGGMHFGEYAVIAVPAISFLLNAALKYLKSNEPK